MNINRARIAILAPIAVVALVVAGCGSSSSGGSSAASSSGPAIDASSTSLGKILTDGSGRTLYLFEKDTGPKSTCSGACASNWPPFTASSAPKVSGGAASADIKLVARGGGQKQVTYKGHPLYYFAGDQASGDINGQGMNAFGAKWYVLSSSGSKVAGKASSGGSSSGSGSGGYGGY